MKPKTFSQKLEDCRILIFNSNNPEIAPYLNGIGIDEAYLEAGKNLYQEVLDVSASQKKEYQEQSLAYDVYFENKENCEKTYKRNVNIVKVMARNDKDLQSRLLLADSLVHRRATDWIISTIGFYDRLAVETDFMEKLKITNITPEQIAADQQAIQELNLLRNKAVSEKGEAQESTRLRNEKMEALEDYCYELKNLARIALDGQTQYLEILGILVRS
ncbi:MAG: hypothetical protein JEZ01_06885 [Labilibaculum sp.]|nr:hypothetical protein [Labilibaculum sp.]MBI9057483.1 hypothetical protein [Labilibaculum sp.]